MRWVLRKDLVGDTSAHEAGPLRIVGSSLKVALASGFTWGAGALAAAFMACWGMGAWIVLPAGLLATFLIALIVNSARFAFEHGGGGDQIELPDPRLFSDAAVQSLARRLVGARTRLERVLRESPRGKAFDLASVRQSAGEIERRVVVLAARAEYVASFLSATSAAEINAALERARARERAAEEDAGAVYRGLIETYEGHLQSLRVLEREKERFVATGEHLVGTLEAFPADLTRVQCLRLAIGDRERTDEALQSAARVCQSLGAAEEALQDDAFLTRAEPAFESSEPARVRPQT